MAGQSNTTQDHDEIRNWAEERGGKPSHVKSTESKDDIGILRIDFPGYSGDGSLEEITWDQFFEKFDERNLALLYQEETAGGAKSNFNKIVSAETAAENEQRSGSKKAAKKSGGKKTAVKTAASKKMPAKKVAATKAVAKKGAVKKVAAKNVGVKKAAPKKVAAKKVAAKKVAAKKAPAKKVAAKKVAAKKATAKKATSKRR